MSKRLLPQKDTPEWQELLKYCEAGDVTTLTKLSSDWGYANFGSFRRALRHHNIDITHDTPVEIKEEQVILPLPQLMAYKGRKPRRGDEETMTLHMGDEHDGKITPTYNHEVCRDRFDNIFQSVLTIVNLHRNMYPINHLKIIDTGDRIQGENPYQGSKIGETECGARDQVKLLALPLWVELIGSLKQHFKTVEVHFLPGNHGGDKLSPQTSNWDIMLSDLIQAKINWKGVKIYSHDQWYAMVDIEGYRFFCTHMDGIPCQQGVPLMAITRRLKGWYIQFGGFNYALGGHFHKHMMDEVTGRFEFFMTGPLVSDDEWALKKLGVSSNPSAWVFGVHPEHGVTWRYPLMVDRCFIPLPMARSE